MFVVVVWCWGCVEVYIEAAAAALLCFGKDERIRTTVKPGFCVNGNSHYGNTFLGLGRTNVLQCLRSSGTFVIKLCSGRMRPQHLGSAPSISMMFLQQFVLGRTTVFQERSSIVGGHALSPPWISLSTHLVKFSS